MNKHLLKIKTPLLLIILSLNSLAQAPEVHWRRSSWATNKHNNNKSTNYLPVGAPQTQQESGEDWFYSFQKGMNGSNHESYICVGFSSFVNEVCRPCQTIDYESDYDQEHLECKYIRKGCKRGTVSKQDLDGTLQWIRSFNTDGTELLEIRQSIDQQYIYVCGENRSIDVPYNTPNANNLQVSYNNQTPCELLSGQPKIYVAKIEYATGVLVWERIYGSANNQNTFENVRSRASDLIELDNGDIVVTGWESGDGFAMNINGATGDMNSGAFQLLNFSSISNQFASHPQSIEKKLGSNELVITGIIYRSAPDYEDMFILDINSSLSQNNLTTVGAINYLNTASFTRSWDIAIRTNGNILVGAYEIDGTGNWWTDRKGMVLEFSATNLAHINTVTFPLNVTAFDLKVGVTNTSDGGYAAVSSTQTSAPQFSYTSCCSPTYTTLNTWYWSTDAYILKYSSSHALEWEKVFDSETIHGPCLDEDIKKQECLYKILEAPDGGLVVCGNNSNNFDDNYLAKLYGPCQKNLVYSQNTGTTVGLFGSLLINQVRTVPSVGLLNYKDQILIGPGSEITLQGDWRFADSKQVGVPTGIVVYPGGKLILDPQCKLMGISPNDCSSENMWDGIQVYGDRLQPQYAHTQPNPYHGVVVMNGATIEDARTAVAMGDNGWGQNGGVIYAVNSTFRNNFTAVSFMNYFNPAYADGRTFSRFIESSFICDQPMKDSYYGGRASNVFISNWAVHGIKFLGCHFTNNYSGTFNDGKRTTGIFSIDATYDVFPSDNPNTVFQPCDFPDGVKTTFNQLSKGVEYWFEPTYNINNKIRIYQSEFNNNNIGIKSQLDPNTLVFANTFTFTSAFKHDFNIAQPRGILIEGSLNTGIFDNQLFFNSSLTTPFPPIGVQANNTYQFPGFANSISGNIFQSPTQGISSIGTAFTRNNPQIQATCNTYQDLEYDWVVDFDPNALPTGEIFADQTWSQTDPMNTFTSSPTGANIIGTNINGTPNYYTTSGSLNTSNVNLLLPIGNTNCPTRDACWAYGEEGGGGNPEGKSERTGNIMSLIYQGRYDKALDQINNLTDENDKYFFMYLRTIFMNGGNFARLSSTEKTTLIGYAKQNTPIGAYAKAVLNFFTDNSIQNYPDVNPTIKGFTEGINTRISEQPLMERVKMYPNPAKNNINCEFITESSKIKIRIFDVLGTEIYTKELVENKNLNIDCSYWQNGIYLIECDVNGFKVTKKVVVLHE